MPAVQTYDLSSPFDLVPDQSTLDLGKGILAPSDDKQDAALRDEKMLERAAVSGLAGYARLGSSFGGGGVREISGSLAKRDTTLEPNHTQSVTLGVIAAYVVILWNVPVVHWVLWPWKMLTVGFHEFSHAAAGLCTGAKIKSISLDPNEGGCTMMSKGIGFVTLPAGYLGSSLIGAALIFCGFDIVASKVASIVVGVFFLLTLWWARKDWLTILTILFAVGVIVAFWFIAHGAALRFYILFVGVMSSLYSAFDICDDLIFRKVNESDASVFAKRYGGSSQCWGVLWVIISLALAACGIIAGLAVFKDSFAEQATRGKEFLPTRLLF
ncbi:M50 family metallopeptidase [Sporobolomyces salmoneus]|uniref:M50 family metallopeptidase n=1 Tax=Sporobolomyces salmoneus TaxID=183962 RepID=UPI003177666B